MRRTMVMVRRLVLLASATAGLLVVATEPANAICTPNCCPWNSVHAAATAPGEPVPGRPVPQYCDIQHCEPVLRY